MIDDFEIKDIKGVGKFLYSLRRFDKNQVLFRFDCGTISSKNASTIPTSALQIGEDIYLDLENHFGSFINHNCNPNSYVKIAVNKAFLVAANVINEGDQITFDYSLTSNEGPNTFVMSCNCSQFKCRKIISGFQTLPMEKQASAIIAGIVPKYNIK
jgi:SET domain-containing protein